MVEAAVGFLPAQHIAELLYSEYRNTKTHTPYVVDRKHTQDIDEPSCDSIPSDRLVTKSKVRLNVSYFSFHPSL